MATRDGALLQGRCVLLVDDVTTSVATLAEAAAVMRAAGALDVHAVALCHTEG
jgi:predicted amidophosphoribosyltransferase